MGVICPSSMGGAQLLVYPSWDEGFGFPPLEAMACGTPVLCSDVPAVTEVCGDAAYLVEPDETESIAGGMLDILTQPSFAQRLVKRGHERAVKYSWGAYANGLLASYEAAFAHRRQTAPINNSVST
jgi:glycosyltransferase involved in cell wall biosynthesis